MQDKPLPLTTRKLRGLPVHRREQIQTLKAKGWSKSFIARATRLHRETVAKYWDDLHLEPTPTKRWLN